MTSDVLQHHIDVDDKQQKPYLSRLKTRQTAMSLAGMVMVNRQFLAAVCNHSDLGMENSGSLLQVAGTIITYSLLIWDNNECVSFHADTAANKTGFTSGILELVSLHQHEMREFARHSKLDIENFAASLARYAIVLNRSRS